MIEQGAKIAIGEILFNDGVVARTSEESGGACAERTAAWASTDHQKGASRG